MTWLQQIPGVRDIVTDDGETLPRTNDLELGAGLSAVYDTSTRRTVLTATGAEGSITGALVDELRDQIDDATVGIKLFGRGHTTPNDGGQGTWTVVVGDYTDNTGTVLVPGGHGASVVGGKALVRDYSGALDVRWFGAFPGGGDASIALGRAFAGGGPVLAPPGIYQIEASLDLPSSLDLTAWGATFRAKNGTTFNAILYNTAPIANLTIRGLTLDANGDNRTSTGNTKDGSRMVGLTDALYDSCTVKNCLGTPGTAVGFALTAGLRVRYINCMAIDNGRVGRIADGWYSNGQDIRYANCYAIRCQDTAFVFENATRSGGSGLHIDGLIATATFTADHPNDRFASATLPADGTQIKFYTTGTLPAGFTVGNPVYVRDSGVVAGTFKVSATEGGAAITFADNGTGVHTWKQFAGAGIAIGVAGNTDMVDNGFTDVKINDVIAPVEFGLFGPNTNTGKIRNTTFANVTVDSIGAGFPAFFFYPNPQVNPGALVYSGRITNTTINGCKVPECNGLQGVYATQCDELIVAECDFNLTAAAIQTAEGNPTKLDIHDNVIDVAATFGFQFGTGITGAKIQDNHIRGTAAMAWGMYFFGTSTGISTPANDIEGSALNDQSGIGADATTQPRLARDGPNYVTTTPQPATGIWPLGFVLLNKTTQLTEDASHPEGWIVTMAGVPGSGAVFTPFFRERRTAGEAGTLNSANTIDHVRTPASGGHYVAYNARGDSADATKFVGFGFSNASNAAGNLGYFAADGNGNVRLAVLAGLSLGFNTNANFPGTYTEIVKLLADGLCVPAVNDGYTLGTDGADGGIQNAGSGIVQVSARVRGELGINSNDSYPWATFTTALYWRAITGAIAVGINADPSDRAALLSFAAGSANYDQLCMRVSSTIPTTKLDGAMSYTVNGLHFCMGTTTRYNVALKVTDVNYNVNTTINAGLQADQTITVAGSLVGDKVLVDFTAGGLDTGLVFGGAWVSATDTVKVRIYNPTAGNITSASVNWKVSVIHT